MSPPVVLIGFATVDYVTRLKQPFPGTGTVAMVPLDDSSWPRAGGAALYAGRQLALGGLDVAAVTWVGDDASGSAYLAACRESGLDVSGVSVRKGCATPTCVLIYQPDGDYGCLFNPGPDDQATLNSRQRELCSAAEMLIIAVGPPGIGDELLGLISPRATVAWIAKGDEKSCPANLRQKYAARANYIFCNQSECQLVDAAVSQRVQGDKTIFETRGSAGVVVDHSGASFTMPVAAINAADTTGAGDTFAGAVMAHLFTNRRDIQGAVTAGIDAAAILLRSRLPDEGLL